MHMLLACVQASKQPSDVFGIICMQAALDTLCHLVATEYVSHDKLSAIFAAREDMRAALTKLEHVFHAGTVSSQGSHEVADVDGAQPAATAYSIAQGIVSEEVSKQVSCLAHVL